MSADFLICKNTRFDALLSEELHALTFHDFDGAGRFILFVFLVGNDDSEILAYINKFLTAATLPVMNSNDKFCLHSTAGYALRIELPSIAAVTYYGISLVGYVAIGLPISE